MLDLPASTLLDRKIPKSKFYEKLHAKTKLKELFVRQVDSIVWKHKLSRETIRLEPKGDVEEIQVFEIQLKQKEFSRGILENIDKAIPYPILYVLLYRDQVKLSMAYKERSRQDENKFVVRSYHESGWQSVRQLRFQAIYGLDLKAVYDHMIRQLLAVQADPQEELAATLERQARIDTLTKEIQKLESRIRREKQFNRKVEMNMERQHLDKKLKELLDE